jgi:hypothetical protein
LFERETIMKKYLAIGLVIASALTAMADPRPVFRAPIQPKKHPRPAPTPPIYREKVQGVVPRAVRGGNPLQMINPYAPAKYGTAEQSVVLDPDTGKWKGIKLFEFIF